MSLFPVRAMEELVRKKPLPCSDLQENPYAMVRGAELEGYCIDLLQKLSEMLHFKYKVGIVKDGKYGRLSSNGSWSGMIGEIVRKVRCFCFFSWKRCSSNKERDTLPPQYSSRQPLKYWNVAVVSI